MVHISVTSIGLSGVLWILSHSDLALGAQVVIWFRNLGMCLTLIADLCLRGGDVIYLRRLSPLPDSRAPHLQCTTQSAIKMVMNENLVKVIAIFRCVMHFAVFANLCPAIWKLNPVLPADDTILALVFYLRRLKALGINAAVLIGKWLWHRVFFLHIGLLIRLQLILLLFCLVVSGHFVRFLIGTLLIVPSLVTSCLVGVVLVLVYKICLIPILSERKSWKEDQGKIQRHAKAWAGC